MKRMACRLLAGPVAVLVVIALAAPASAAPASGADRVRTSLSGRGHYLHRGARGEADVNVCSDAVGTGVAHCDAHLRTDLLGAGEAPAVGAAGPDAASSHASSNGTIGDNGAYGPLYLQSAYNAPSATNGTGETVAIVDAYDVPTVESDLATYRSNFGLSACTTANGCFRRVDQNGGTNYPAANTGWGEETSLDLDMVSALCPNCHILLVEATTNSMTDLGAAVDTAVALGANVVSNSYGSSESSFESALDSAYYNHPGIAIVASSGDNGFGVSYPAASPDVISVGGTSLLQETNTGTRDAVETVWSGAGSGCSAYEPKPAWQTDTGCSRRTVTDVSADADPSTGVWVYDSSAANWMVFGGTSVAAPIVSAIFALAGNAASSNNVSAYPYAHRSSFNDVTLGTNGTCGGTYLCTGQVGYDGPTGLGTPASAAVFADPSPPAPAPPPAAPPLSPPGSNPDFAVTASTVGAIRAGATGSSTVGVTPQNGFAGAVSVSAAVSPASGLTAVVNPGSIVVGGSDQAALTLTGKVGGTYTVTITATQGALVHTKTLKVAVNDFSIRVAPAKTTVARGKPVRYTVTLKSLGAFASWVTLSVTGRHTHDTVTFGQNPGPASGTQTVTITTSTRDARGTITLRFTGVSGTLTHSVSAVLTIQ
jgi:hypothetical protein